ncbi:MAG: hypothetical protein AB7O26_18770 [Planctomycetaceae bacterium]
MQRRSLWSAVAILLAASACFAADAADKKPDRATLEKEFSEKLTGSALIGAFTVDGQASDKPPHTERYELDSVSKTAGDNWTFVSRIKYGQNDVKVPLTIKVLWAGDTPVISLTDFEIPGLGTFTARVMFYGDRYVGTWQHGEVGGHMFGKIEKGKPAAEPKPAK